MQIDSFDQFHVHNLGCCAENGPLERNENAIKINESLFVNPRKAGNKLNYCWGLIAAGLPSSVVDSR